MFFTIIAALAGCAGVAVALVALDHSRDSTPPPPTRVVVFAAGSPISTENGGPASCRGPSNSTERADSLRCFYDGPEGQSFVVDPCFEFLFAEPRIAICPDNPWVGEGTILTPITESDPAADESTTSPDGQDFQQLDVKAYTPWALELANGDRCRFATGVTRPPGLLVRTTYVCDRGVVIGEPYNDSDVWTVLWGEDVDGDLRQIVVTTAWL